MTGDAEMARLLTKRPSFEPQPPGAAFHRRANAAVHLRGLTPGGPSFYYEFSTFFLPYDLVLPPNDEWNPPARRFLTFSTTTWREPYKDFDIITLGEHFKGYAAGGEHITTRKLIYVPTPEPVDYYFRFWTDFNYYAGVGVETEYYLEFTWKIFLPSGKEGFSERRARLPTGSYKLAEYGYQQPIKRRRSKG